MANLPASVPIAMGTRPALRADPAPDDEPPGKYWVLYQFVAVPVAGLQPVVSASLLSALLTLLSLALHFKQASPLMHSPIPISC